MSRLDHVVVLLVGIVTGPRRQGHLLDIDRGRTPTEIFGRGDERYVQM